VPASGPDDGRIPPFDPPPATGDARAEAEYSAIATGSYQAELQERADRGDHDRRERLRDVLSWIVVRLAVVGAFLLLALLISWTWHLLAPGGWHYLTDAQITRIETVLFSSFVGGVISTYARRYL
jgi:hypothetical protein